MGANGTKNGLFPGILLLHHSTFYSNHLLSDIANYVEVIAQSEETGEEAAAPPPPVSSGSEFYSFSESDYFKASTAAASAR